MKLGLTSAIKEFSYRENMCMKFVSLDECDLAYDSHCKHALMTARLKLWARLNTPLSPKIKPRQCRLYERKPLFFFAFCCKRLKPIYKDVVLNFLKPCAWWTHSSHLWRHLKVGSASKIPHCHQDACCFGEKG